MFEIDNDTAEFDGEEDQGADAFDSLEDAMDALGDDDEELLDEQPVEDDADDETAEDEETSDQDDDAEDDADLADGEDVVVTLSDGSEVPLAELKDGYFRQSDYTEKTEALAQERKAVDAIRADYEGRAQNIETAYQNLTNFVASLLPPEPDQALATSDPAAYVQQLAARNQMMQEMEAFAGQQHAIAGQMSEAHAVDLARMAETEQSKLLETMPELKDPGRKAAFDASVKKAAEHFGFSEEEVGGAIDHRILRMAHYAQIGLQKAENRKNAARRLAEKPGKGRRAAPAAKPPKNRQAMRRLAKSGSFEDAMNVDFD